MLCPKEPTSFGWSKKILSSLTNLIENNEAEKIAALGNVRVSTIKKILDKKELVLKGIKNGFLFPVTQADDSSKKFWQSLLFSLIEKEKLFLDRQTSVDLAKIIRVPNTIHGSTGLQAKKFSREELKEFNPLKESILFSTNPIKVFVKKTPKFLLGGESFGPFNEQETELPEFVGIYLMSRDSAELI